MDRVGRRVARSEAVAPVSGVRDPIDVRQPLRLARFPPARAGNPYYRLLYDGLREFGVELVAEPVLSVGWLWRARRDVDVLHFHWRPDRYYAWRRPLSDPDLPPPRWQNVRSWIRLGGFAWRLVASRLLGYGVVWTIHEVYPPETATRPAGAVSRRIDRLGGRLLARRCSLLLSHDAATAERARAEFGRPASRIEIVPHGSYVGVYPSGRPRAEVRRELDIAPDAFTFLCFGALRPDKAVGLVLDSFRSVDCPDVVLVVAGGVEDPRPRDRVLAAAAADARIRPRLHFVDDDRLRELFGAVDAVVLGRSEVWTSGSLILALSLGVPAVAAALPPYDELLAGGEAGWLFQAGDVESLRAAMETAAASPDDARAKGAVALRQAEQFPSWLEIAERTAALMLQRCDGRSVGRRPVPAPSEETR